MIEQENMITDTESSIKYKIVNKDGSELSVENSRQLAEMYINNLPQDLRESCRIVPITEDNKQVLFG